MLTQERGYACVFPQSSTTYTWVPAQDTQLATEDHQWVKEPDLPQPSPDGRHLPFLYSGLAMFCQWVDLLMKEAELICDMVLVRCDPNFRLIA